MQELRRHGSDVHPWRVTIARNTSAYLNASVTEKPMQIMSFELRLHKEEN